MLLGNSEAVFSVQIALRLPAIGAASRYIMLGMPLGGCGILIRGDAQVALRLLGASPIAAWCVMLIGNCGAVSRSGVQIALRLPTIGTACRCIMIGMLPGGCRILIGGDAQVALRLLGASPIAAWCVMLLGNCGAVFGSGVQSALRLPRIGTASRTCQCCAVLLDMLRRVGGGCHGEDAMIDRVTRAGVIAVGNLKFIAAYCSGIASGNPEGEWQIGYSPVYQG
jgi:hypothetical protein